MNIIIKNIVYFIMTKLKIKIFDKNFYPNISASRFGTPKYIEWIFVNDESELNSDDVVVYTDQFIMKANKHNVNKKIAWILEPPVSHKYPYEYTKEHYNEFDVIFTFINDHLKLLKNGYYLPNIMTYMEDENRLIHKKTKLISLIFSSKAKSKNHKFRKDIVDMIQTNNLNVDMYGPIVNKFVEKKSDAINNYMFHIVVENCNNDGYYSEKTLDCFLTGTVPIIYGDSCIINNYNKDGIIFFKNIQTLKNLILTLTENDYINRLDKIKENYDKACIHVTPEDYIYDNFKELLQKKS